MNYTQILHGSLDPPDVKASTPGPACGYNPILSHEEADRVARQEVRKVLMAEDLKSEGSFKCSWVC